MKQKFSAKRSLIFSVLSLLLCCAMLVGTTFAWFTDSVTSGNNKIVAGNLDVELYHSNQEVTDVKVDENTLLFQQKLWEPGVAVYENFKVTNEGTLALKYQLLLNATNATKTPTGKTLADILQVGVVKGGVSGDRDAVVAAVTNVKEDQGFTWQPLSSFVLENALSKEGAENDTDVYGIVIWWEPSDIDNEFNMNNENKETVLSIDIAISLFATQVAEESDAFGIYYDEAAALPELVAKNEELEEAVTADVEHIVVNLAADLTYDVGAWQTNAMGGASTKTVTINGNGYTINFNQTNSDWSNITAGDGIKLIINDANVTNSGYNNGPWNRHDLNFACEVELNNVTSNKAMAFKNSATLNNVTIADANTSDTYAIWIQPAVEGQTVTLNNCVIDMLDCTDGRGIKIDNQYVAAADEKIVTLNVSDTTIKTEEKSAILVKTTVGANVNLSNVDISGVLADPITPVWVDEAAAAAYDLVVVNGGTKVLEGKADYVVASNIAQLMTALTGDEEIVLSSDVTIDSLDSRLTMNGGSLNGNGKTVTYAGGRLSNGGSAPVLTTKGGSISNLTVEAPDGRALYVTTLTENLYVTDCVLSGSYAFNLNSSVVTDYTINFTNTVFKSWVSYANVVEVANFENCVFEGNLRPYGDTVLTNCQFNGEGTLDLSKLVAGESITLTGCTNDGVAITIENIRDVLQTGSDLNDYTVAETNGVITITK